MKESFFNFLDQLSKNNSKEWFDMNRARYETDVKKPFEEFSIALGSKISEYDPEIMKDYKKCIFRINRDIRFSKNKTPYKTNRSVAYSKNGKNDLADPGYYIQLGAEQCMIAGGAWNPSPELLKKIRKEIYYCTEEFHSIVTQPDFLNLLGGVKGDLSKRLDKEAQEWSKDSEYIFFKQYYFFTEFSPKECLKDDFVETLSDKLKIAHTFNQFLRRAMNDQ